MHNRHKDRNNGNKQNNTDKSGCLLCGIHCHHNRKKHKGYHRALELIENKSLSEVLVISIVIALVKCKAKGKIFHSQFSPFFTYLFCTLLLSSETNIS
ncbi:MAG: paraquat-inducible protein A [Clostridia bacterium]|nr:paraquat-inducible protein A [Clostridia bacterium]